MFGFVFWALFLWATSAKVDSVVKSDSLPVSLGLYYESLCPGCQELIIQQLWPTYSQLGTIMDLTLVPYGNSEVKRKGKKWIFTCQHGPEECYANVVQTCSIFLLNDTSLALNFIKCMSADEKPWLAGEKCARSLLLDWKVISTCSNGTRGNEYEYLMAKKTRALDPPHKYSPWITLNGVHTEDIQDKAETNLFQLICDTYTGKKPSSCNTIRNEKNV